MHQPTTYRVKIGEVESGLPSNTARVDASGYIILSARDIQRIATAVVDLLGQQTAPDSAEPEQEQPYVSVRRNAPQRPTSEY